MCGIFGLFGSRSIKLPTRLLSGGIFRMPNFRSIWSLCAVTAAGTDINNTGPVQEAIHNGHGDGGVPQDISPVLKANCGGDDKGGAPLARVDQIQEEAWVFRFWPKIADIINDQ